jgi:RNA polymerase sigma factor (sigma-70 family)
MEAAADPGRALRAFPLSGRRQRRAAGERIAALFEEHGRMVYGVCRLILRDPVEAEDAAQQTFLSAYRALLAGRQPRDASAWLGTIARNECRRRLRARRTEPARLSGEPVGDELQRDVGRRDEIHALCAALVALPTQQRDVIVLRELYGFSYAEVGAALGLTGPAVESLVFRSRRRLQEQLRPLRSALGVLALPVTLRDSLAQALPGFGGAGASAGAGAAALAKLGSTPVAAKVAAATLAIGGAGTVASLETAHVVRHRAGVRHVAAAASAPVAPAALAAPTPVRRSISQSAAPSSRVETVDVVSKEHAHRRGPSSAETEHRGSGGGEIGGDGPSHEASGSRGPSPRREEPSHSGDSRISHASGSDHSGSSDSRSGSGSGSGDSGSRDSGSGSPSGSGDD